MIDRTDLQLLLCGQIMEMDTHELMELASEITGHDLEMHNEEEEIMVGSLEPPVISDPPGFKKWLGFLQYALGERVQQNQAQG